MKIENIPLFFQDTGNLLFHTGRRYLYSLMASRQSITYPCQHISYWVGHHMCATPQRTSSPQETTSLTLRHLESHLGGLSHGNKYGTWQISVDTPALCHTHDSAYIDALQISVSCLPC